MKTRSWPAAAVLLAAPMLAAPALPAADGAAPLQALTPPMGWNSPDGRIVPDPQRFPSGMKVLAEYIHAKGLRFGIYSDARTATCGKRPGSKGHEKTDTKTYAEWASTT